MLMFEKKFDLFLISFLILFLELAMIRWLPGTATALSYFTNLILISSFFGMGLGAMLSEKKPKLARLPIIFFALVIFAIVIKKVGVLPIATASDFLFFNGIQNGLPLLFVVPVFFFLNVLFFLPLGQVLGKNFDKFKPLEAYLVNIAGSIAGTIGFTALSFFSMPPIVWFAVALALVFWFLRDQKIHFYGGAAIVIVALVVVGITSISETWSPYQKIVINPEDDTQYFSLWVNNNYYLSASKFDEETLEKYPYLKEWKDIYSLPYKFISPKNVLIVGSGGANDLSLALENNPESIDCVEIDPKIIDFTKQLRKDNPYSDPRVNVFVDDARSFLKSTDKKYDLIVYGFLDSHRLFSNMANIRLDDFVYTVEGISEAKEHLNEAGVIALSFYATKPWVEQKLYDILAQNFSQKPLVFSNNKMPWEKVFIATDDKEKLKQIEITGFTEGSQPLELNSNSFKVPTDDWPYLYMKNNFIPIEYLGILAIILVLCTAMVIIFMGQFGKTIQNLHFFLLGAAFMLLETKGIIEFALLFGSSWIVNSIVITSILIMIFLANLYIIKFNPKKTKLFYLLLFLSLILLFFFPPKSFVSFDPLTKLLASSFIVTLPILFAALVFSSLFKKSEKTSTALGFNLIGVVLGGFLEYSSLMNGINSLAIIAFALYLLSFIFARKYL